MAILPVLLNLFPSMFDFNDLMTSRKITQFYKNKFYLLSVWPLKLITCVLLPLCHLQPPLNCSQHASSSRSLETRGGQISNGCRDQAPEKLILWRHSMPQKSCMLFVCEWKTPLDPMSCKSAPWLLYLTLDFCIAQRSEIILPVYSFPILNPNFQQSTSSKIAFIFNLV